MNKVPCYGPTLQLQQERWAIAGNLVHHRTLLLYRDPLPHKFYSTPCPQTKCYPSACRRFARVSPVCRQPGKSMLRSSNGLFSFRFLRFAGVYHFSCLSHFSSENVGAPRPESEQTCPAWSLPD